MRDTIKRETTAKRLRQLMDERGLRQVDVLKLVEPWAREYNVPFFKQNLSLYLKGTVEPNQDKLILLGKALNVSEAWLMGFDVPRERNSAKPESYLVDEDQRLIVDIVDLDADQKELLRNYVALLKRTKK